MGSTGHSSLSMTSAHAAASDVPSGEPARPTLAARASPDFEAIYREHFRFVWRSVRRLGIKAGAAVAPPPTPAEYLARRAAERAGKPSGDPA